MPVAVQPRRFTVDDYYAMADAGVFAPDERVELLDGEILTMPPIGPPHVGTVNQMNSLFVRALGSRAVVQIQGPVRLSNDSEPQPDIAILRPRGDFYRSRHAGPADVFALIEVADSSIGYDSGRKLKAYARSAIAEYWLVDLQAERIQIHRHPAGEQYRNRVTVQRGEIVAFEAFPEDHFVVVDVLGAPGP